MTKHSLPSMPSGSSAPATFSSTPLVFQSDVAVEIEGLKKYFFRKGEKVKLEGGFLWLERIDGKLWQCEPCQAESLEVTLWYL